LTTRLETADSHTHPVHSSRFRADAVSDRTHSWNGPIYRFLCCSNITLLRWQVTSITIVPEPGENASPPAQPDVILRKSTLCILVVKVMILTSNYTSLVFYIILETAYNYMYIIYIIVLILNFESKSS